MKNGVEMIFGIFNILNYFDRKADAWRLRGYAYKILVFLGLVLLGLIAVGFTVGAFACFKQMDKGLAHFLVFVFFGIICAVCAVYCVFYFFVETISLMIICGVLVGKQRAYKKRQAESFEGQKAMEEAKASGQIAIDGQEAEPVEKYQFDAKDQYQKEQFADLRPVKKGKRISFRERLMATANEPYLQTKPAFDITIMVLTGLLLVGMAFWAFAAISGIN